MRLIDDELYAALIKIMAQDPKIAAFQKLIMSPKVDNIPEENNEETKSEAEK